MEVMSVVGLRHQRSLDAFEGKLAGREPQTSFPASLQPDLERNQDRGQPASLCSKMDASYCFPKWDTVVRLPGVRTLRIL